MKGGKHYRERKTWRNGQKKSYRGLKQIFTEVVESGRSMVHIWLAYHNRRWQAKVIGGVPMNIAIVINMSQWRPSIKHADWHPRLARDNASEKHKGKGLRRTEDCATCDCDISHCIITSEKYKGVALITNVTMIDGPDKIMDDIWYILRSENRAFSM